MFEQQLSGCPEVLVVNGGYQKTAPSQIGFEAPACERS
jgi:hypothetical protein